MDKKLKKQQRAQDLQKLYDEGKLLTEEFYLEMVNQIKKYLMKYLIKNGYYKNGVAQTNFDAEDVSECYIYVMKHILGTFITKKGKESFVKYDSSRGNIASYIHSWSRGYCSSILTLQKKEFKYAAHKIFALDDILNNNNNIPNTLTVEGCLESIEEKIELEKFLDQVTSENTKVIDKLDLTKFNCHNPSSNKQNKTIKEVNMEIKQYELNRDVVLIFSMCDETTLDFKKVKELYLNQNKVFWNFIYILFPVFKTSVKRFESLADSATLIHSKLVLNNDIKLSSKDFKIYSKLTKIIKNKFSNEGELYDLQDVSDYIHFNPEAKIEVFLYNDKHYKNVDEEFVINYINSISQINIGDKIFKTDSIYGFKLEEELTKNTVKKQALKKTLDYIEGLIDEEIKECGKLNEQI